MNDKTGKSYKSINFKHLTVLLDTQTWSLLDLAAVNQGLDMQELAAQIIYRDVAARTGWPGNDGLRMRKHFADIRAFRDED